MKLDVFHKAYEASLEIHRVSKRLPKDEQYELAQQLRRSSKSICANLVEGLGKRESVKESLRYLRVAIGSKEETKLWLQYCVDLGYFDQAQYERLRETYEEIGRMLEGLRKHLEGQI